MLNEVGMPPAGRTVARRRGGAEAQAQDEAERPGVESQLKLTIITFVGIVAAGLLLAWLIF